MPLSSKPVGPTGPAHPHAHPTGTFPARETYGYFGDLSGDAPLAQPTEPSMPLRPRLAPGTPMQAMDLSTDPSGAGKHPFVVILSKQQATDIYMMRSPESTTDAFKEVAGKSSMVAEMYRVSPKTIRDIWNRKTWTQVTRASWTSEEAEDYAQEQALLKLPPAQRAALKEELKKRRGRPPGSKDTRPRRRRLKAGEKGEPSEGVMYVTTDQGAVEVRPIPAAPRTSDSIDRSASSPVRQAPPYNAQRVSGIKALRAFECNKATAEAKLSARSQSFDFSPPAPYTGLSDTLPRSHSFDGGDSITVPAPLPTNSVPHVAPGAGLSEDFEGPAEHFQPSASFTGKARAAVFFGDEEPGACDDEPSCGFEPGESSQSQQEASQARPTEEDPDFQQQNILGPVDDQLDLYNAANYSAAKVARTAPPAAPYWATAQKEEPRQEMSLEQELEFRKQRHQAHFAESRSMLSWIAQHHSNPYPACAGSGSFSMPAALAPAKTSSPIVSSMAAAPAVDSFSSVPEAQCSGPSGGHEGAEHPTIMSLMMESGGVESHQGHNMAQQCDSGFWFPGSQEQHGRLGGHGANESSGMGMGMHQQHHHHPAGDLHAGEWHAPFLMSRESSRDVSGLDKHLLPSAGSSPCISHVLARSGMSGLQSEDGWWGVPSSGGLESGSWRADLCGRPL